MTQPNPAVSPNAQRDCYTKRSAPPLTQYSKLLLLIYNESVNYTRLKETAFFYFFLCHYDKLFYCSLLCSCLDAVNWKNTMVLLLYSKKYTSCKFANEVDAEVCDYNVDI